jgi:hypothetical protein
VLSSVVGSGSVVLRRCGLRDRQPGEVERTHERVQKAHPLNQATMAETCLRTIWPIGSSDVCISYYIMPTFIRQGYPLDPKQS